LWDVQNGRSRFKKKGCNTAKVHSNRRQPNEDTKERCERGAIFHKLKKIQSGGEFKLLQEFLYLSKRPSKSKR